jgi:hypothetical protein
MYEEVTKDELSIVLDGWMVGLYMGFFDILGEDLLRVV